MSTSDDVVRDYLDMTNIDNGLLPLSPMSLPKSGSLPFLMVERRVVRSTLSLPQTLLGDQNTTYTGLRKLAAFVTADFSLPSVTVSGVVAAAADQ